MFNRHTLALHEPFLPGLARLLLDVCGDRLPRALVLLPSSRACGSLRHALLAASGGDGLLLPAVATPSTLVEQLAERMAELAPATVPQALRAAVLAPRLNGLDWLRDRPGAATGMAEELVRIFDELRRHELDPDALEDGGPTATELQIRDVARVRETWRLYRSVITRDALDREREVIDAAHAADRWPGAPVNDLFAAGFSDLAPLTARLIRTAARGAEHAHLVSPTAGADHLTRLYLAAFSDADAPTHPLSPDRHAAARLMKTDPPSLGRDSRPYLDRLAGLDEPAAVLAPAGLPLLHPCPDPEQESRLVSDLVIDRLRREPRSRIAVATADRVLARRIADQLTDAGLDLDATDGEPLSNHADGRLVWALLRTAQTDGHAEPLLELLTHPLVSFGRERAEHRSRSLSFEKELLRGRMVARGMTGLRARAEKRDADVRAAWPEAQPEMTRLMDDLEGALGDLLRLAKSEPAPMSTHLSALREAWLRAAPDTPLLDTTALPGLDKPRPARRALLRLLDDLDIASDCVPPLSAAEFAAMLARLLGQELVRPHRSVHLPVQVTGLLEARLEHYDLLVVAGLGEGVFPDEPRSRTLLLGRPWRERHGLPDWRWDLGLDAELFLRLLHNGRRVVVTWSRERDGQPALPSPLVGRLLLATATPPEVAPRASLWCAEAADTTDTAQSAFASEPRARPVHARSRPLTRLSYSALSIYRDCPYRFLLEKGYGLREQERVFEELQKKDYGSVAHETMRRFLRDDGPGARALLAKDRDAALSALRLDTREAFSARIGDVAQRRLWAAAFLAMADDIVDMELAYAADRRGLARESGFAFTLGELHAWLSAQGAAPLPLDDDAAAITCQGRLDRVDLGVDGASVHVIDYKTGDTPTPRKVAEGADLQLVVYALAVRLGRVDGAPVDASLTGSYYGLKPGKVGCDPSKPHLRADHDLIRDGGVVLATSLAMADREHAYGLIPPDLDPDHQDAPCRYCPWRGACRIDEQGAASGEEATP